MKKVEYKTFSKRGNIVTFKLMDDTELTMKVKGVYYDIYMEATVQGREFVMIQNGTLYEREDGDEWWKAV